MKLTYGGSDQAAGCYFGLVLGVLLTLVFVFGVLLTLVLT